MGRKKAHKNRGQRKGRKKSVLKLRTRPEHQFCCNPFKNHGSRRKCRKINYQIIEAAKAINISLNRERKLCNSCRVKILSHKNVESVESVEVQGEQEEEVGEDAESSACLEPMETSGESSSPSEFEDPIDQTDKVEVMKSLNTLLSQLKIETVDSKKLRYSTFPKAVIAQLNDKLSDLFGLSDERIIERNEMVSQLKAKFAETNDRNDRFRILSVLPKSWSINRIQTEFQATQHMARKVKKMVEQQGIMCSRTRKIGSRTLPEATVEKVKQFFESEDISRPTAGKRDYKTYNENMVRVTKQRRLVLMNLREAYELL